MLLHIILCYLVQNCPLRSLWHGSGTVQRLTWLYYADGTGKACLEEQQERDTEKLQQCKKISENKSR